MKEERKHKPISNEEFYEAYIGISRKMAEKTGDFFDSEVDRIRERGKAFVQGRNYRHLERATNEQNPARESLFGKALYNAYSWARKEEDQDFFCGMLCKLEERTMTKDQYEELMDMPQVYERMIEGDKRAESRKGLEKSFHSSCEIQSGKMFHMISYTDGIEMLRGLDDRMLTYSPYPNDGIRTESYEMSATEIANDLEGKFDQNHCSYRTEMRDQTPEEISFYTGDILLTEDNVSGDFSEKGKISTRLKNYFSRE